MKSNNYCVYNKYNRKVVFTGSYNDCLNYFNTQDKIFRKQHKIIDKK